MNAPTMPPITAPQLARDEPPYFFVYFAVSENSITSPITASTATATTVNMLIEPGTRIE